jgi:hypothetical protein
LDIYGRHRPSAQGKNIDREAPSDSTDPKGDWYCAVHISGWRRHIIPAFGIGPLDSLANALQVVQFCKEEIGTSHIIWKPGKRSRIEPRVS